MCVEQDSPQGDRRELIFHAEHRVQFGALGQGKACVKDQMW